MISSVVNARVLPSLRLNFYVFISRAGFMARTPFTAIHEKSIRIAATRCFRVGAGRGYISTQADAWIGLMVSSSSPRCSHHNNPE